MSGEGVRALVMDTARRRLVRRYLGVAVVLTLVSAAVHGLIAPATGLVRTFYPETGFSGEPLFQDRTSELSLAFLDEDPTLPRRFFSVEWNGFWFLPRATTVELYAGGDDRVDVAVDGQRVLRRNIAVGMHTVGETITLSAGAHEILVRYAQEGGGASLNILYAVDGEPPGALVPTQLFPERPETLHFWLASGSYWLIRIVAVLWLVLLAGLLMVFGGWAGLWTVRYWRTVGAPTVKPAGDIERLSVAVILDDQLVAETDADGAQTFSTNARAPEDVEKIRSLVAAAVGLEPARGDLLTVENVAFEETFEAEVIEPPIWEQYLPQVIEAARILGVLLLAVAAFLFGIRPLVRRVSSLQAAGAGAGRLQGGFTSAQLNEAEAMSPRGRLEALNTHANTLSSKEPENAARLVRAWLGEEKR